MIHRSMEGLFVGGNGSAVNWHIRKVSMRGGHWELWNFPSQTPPPPFDGKNIFSSTFFFYAFIMFIITKFGENFEEKIDIGFF